VASCWSLKDFKSIIYRNNEFGIKSAEAILNLVSRRQPFHLEELRINHCKVIPKTINYLLSELNKISYLSKLSLVESNLNNESISLLCQLLKTNKHLDHVDISWNNLATEHWKEFLMLLSTNRKIKFLNLSWN
jgi:hypothetical protein